MPAITGTSGRRYSDRTGQQLPPRRGEPFFSERHGHLRVVPREGGKAVRFEPGKPPKFDPRKALSSAGLAADKAAGSVGRAGLQATQTLGGEAASPFAGAGGVLITVLGSLLALILLDLFLGPRSPTLVKKTLGTLAGGISKLVNPADPLIGKTAPGATSSSTAEPGTVAGGATASLGGKPASAYPSMTPAGGNAAVPGFSHLRAAPQADIRHVDLRILSVLEQVGARLGRVITIISGYRDPAYSASVGGYSTDPHTRGVAVDAYIGSTPVGNYKGAFSLLESLGLESGATPNFYRGQPDPEHVQLPGSGVDKSIIAQRWLG